MSKQKILIIVLFLAAAALRFADIFRPINQIPWRESDLGGIARNFVREGMNPLYPRVDWRGDGPGYAEMELPLYPWLVAVTYQIFGIHDNIGRVWSFIFSLGTLFFFFRLARSYLSEFASIVAFAFFALNPLIVDKSTAIQPEGLTLFAYIAAVYYFLRWLKFEDIRSYWLAVFMTALTLLAKAPAAHIGLFFGVLLIEKYGISVIKQVRIWLFGILSVVPSALWYFHAKNLWIVYGNSLGVSNEYHWIGWDFLTNPNFITGILRSELLYVWVSFGFIVGAFAIWRGYSENVAKHSLLWLASIFAMYILAARTTSEGWAVYYHIFSIPPVALIFGFSIKKLWDYAQEFTDEFSQRSLAANLSRIAIFFVVIAAIFASLLVEAKQVRGNFIDHRVEKPAFVFAQLIKPMLKTDGLIVVSGGNCIDAKGYQLAYNASYMFYWLDRYGWNTCVEEQTATKMREFAAKGGKYLVAEKRYMKDKPGFEDEIKAAYPMLADSADFSLYELTEGR